ncbi:MAG: SRPBCC family protein [Gemmatimonadales bacterium]
MLRIILIILGILLGLVVLVAVIGLALPRRHRATSSVVLAAPPDSVWAIVSDPNALVGTWSELESAERLPDRDGKPVWRQKTSGFEMVMIVEEAVPATRLVTRIDAPEDATFGGGWVYELAPEGAGTRVSVTEDGWVGNPLFRTMMYAMGVHRTLDGYLTALGTRLGEQVKPEHQTAR